MDFKFFNHWIYVTIVSLKQSIKDAFSNLKNSTKLGLFSNDLSELNPEVFSSLVNLEELYLGCNKLRHFDLKIMDYIVKVNDINLENNLIENKSELLDYCKQSNIKLKF